MIELEGLSFKYGKTTVLESVDLRVETGKIGVLLGTNGAGKSTLLKCAIGLERPTGGRVLIDGDDARGLTRRQFAQRVAYLPQTRSVPSITVERFVLHGRFPYLGYPRKYGAEDFSICERAIETVDAAGLSQCRMDLLSGGQRQKAYIAMALAQNAETILMDEPTTYLDAAHQLETMKLARQLADRGKAVLMVTHDICQGMRYADYVALLDGGRVAFCGAADELFESRLIDGVFGIKLRRAATDDGFRYYY